MRVIGVKRQLTATEEVDRLVRPEQLLDVLPQMDFVALTWPLTKDTEGLIGLSELEAMKPSAYLIKLPVAGLSTSRHPSMPWSTEDRRRRSRLLL